MKRPENAKRSSFSKNQLVSFAWRDAQKSYHAKIIHGKIKIPANLCMQKGPANFRANLYVFFKDVPDQIKAKPLNLIKK